MDLSAKNPKSATPVKDPRFPSKFHETSKKSENSNPNVADPTNSPVTKSAKSQKSVSKNLVVVSRNPVAYSPRNKIRERKFVVAKKNSKKAKASSTSNIIDCKCEERFGGNVKKCLCVAYETLRASQEEFFNNQDNIDENENLDKDKSFREEEEMEKSLLDQNKGIEDGFGSKNQISEVIEQSGQKGDSIVKRRRDRSFGQVRNSVPEPGKVMDLVKAFEQLRAGPNSKESNEKVEEEIEEKKKETQWALRGLHRSKVTDTHKVAETQVSTSFCPSDLILTSENLGLDLSFSVLSSWDSNQGSISRRTSNGGRRSQRNSSESSGTMGGRRWKKKQQKATSQKPFMLRTEQRGRLKEEEFMKKIQDMMVEEERQRIPIAQGLPWTTDEPECLNKPPVKENTRPIDLQLHSDIRALERSEFDHQVAEKMTQIEQYKAERERLKKLEEEEEIRRLRKELIPKAQPMPYFDRPFIPRRR